MSFDYLNMPTRFIELLSVLFSFILEPVYIQIKYPHKKRYSRSQ